MNQRAYLKLLIETVPGYRGYETIESKTSTDALLREKCSICMNKAKINLDQCRSQLLSSMGTDRSEMKMISGLINLSKEAFMEIMGDFESELPRVEDIRCRERLYELDRNLLELAAQLENLSNEILSHLIAAEDIDYGEQELFLQRGLNNFRELWRKREALFRKLQY